ncbi:MAG: NACHT domain-containing protein, partial [Gemmatimonadales bacterium]
MDSVRQVWIQGVLERSVHDAARLDLGKETRADAVAHPWASIVELPDQARRLLPAGQTMAGLFDEVGRALLILGGPGSGKTISLLELARHLMDRATRDIRSPIPVVFNLSTWTGQSALFDWLVEELKVRYFVPAWQGSAWLKGRRLVLLLDGLDEVRPEARAACVRAINSFAQETGMGGLAVCSRLDEYTTLGDLFQLRGAVCLQPLTRDQVEQYLAGAGASLAALRVALHSDSQLQKLAETPLMLSVMSLAYRGLSVEALSGQELDSVEERREHLFTTYVQRMFARRGKRPSPYPQERILRWLTWLARRMRERAESVFLIERLQPDWLITRTERYIYTVGSRLLGGAALGLVLGSILDLAMHLIGGTGAGLVLEAEDFVLRVTLGLVLGLVSGLVAGVGGALRFERSRRRGETRGRRTARQVVMDVAGYVLALGLVGWLLVVHIGGWDDPVTGLILGLLVGLLFGFFFGLHDSRRGASEDIRTVEALRWSWVEARR